MLSSRSSKVGLTKRSFGLVNHYFEKAYNNDGDDTKAIECMETAAKPMINHIHRKDYKTNIRKIKNYIEDLEENLEEDKREEISHPGFHIPTDSDDFTLFYKRITEFFEPDEFDSLVGVFSGGLPPLCLASEYFDVEDEIVLRYSHVKRSDEKVKITKSMEEKADFEGKKILIVDDIISSGGTIKEVSDYIFNKGASDIFALVVKHLDYYEILRDNSNTTLEEISLGRKV